MTIEMQQTDTQFPVPGLWQIDPAHSSVHFAVRHLGLSMVRGGFRRFTGWIDIAEVPELSRAEAVVDASSIDTHFDMRDGHLLSADFLHAAEYGDIRFRSTSVEPVEGARWDVHGNLTIKGITRPVTLEAVYHGVVEDPMTRAARVGFSAHLTLERHAFEIGMDGPVPNMVGKTILIDVEVEATLQDGRVSPGT